MSHAKGCSGDHVQEERAKLQVADVLMDCANRYSLESAAASFIHK